MRDLIKTGTYGIMHLAVACAVAYALSGDWRVALSIGLVEPLVQTFFYGLHERLWRGLPGPRRHMRQGRPFSGRSRHPFLFLRYKWRSEANPS